MEEYYTPPVSEKLSVDGLETIPVRLKEDTIIEYLGQKIYTSWKSTLRELYANELTAAKKASRMGAHPTIEITLDPRTRELTIQGKDSLGITGEMFKVLRYYGRSGNFSGNDAGQFGFGFKSYVACADEVRVETFARETNEKYGFIGVKGVEFRQVPDEDLTITEYGTKLSLIIMDAQEKGTGEKENIDLADVVDVFEKVCRFAEIDTYFNLSSPIIKKETHSWGEYEFVKKKAGRWKLNYTPGEYARLTCGKKGYDFEYDTGDFYFYGYIAIESDNDKVDLSRHKEIRLVGMPIDVTINEPNHIQGNYRQVPPEYPLSFWYVNLKDERKFTPTADRERLKEGLFDKVNESIVEFLKCEFSRMAIRSFDDYRNSPYKPILNTVIGSGLSDYFDQETIFVCSALNLPVFGVEEENRQESRRRRYGVPEGLYETKLGHLIASSKNVFILRRKRKKDGYNFPVRTAITARKILRAKYPDAEVFLHPGGNLFWNSDFSKIEDDFRLLTQHFGIPDACVEAAIVKKELGKNWRTVAGFQTKAKMKEEAVVWMRTNYKVEPVKKNIKELGEKTVRVRGNIKDWVDLLRRHISKYGFTRDTKGMVGGMTEEEFANVVASTKVLTSEGETTISKASETGNTFTVFEFDDPIILKFYKPKNTKVILATTDESAFGATAYLKLKGKTYKSINQVEPELITSLQPYKTYDPAQVNYLYVAQRLLGKTGKNTQFMELLRNALEHSWNKEEMKSLVNTAIAYKRFVE